MADEALGSSISDKTSMESMRLNENVQNNHVLHAAIGGEEAQLAGSGGACKGGTGLRGSGTGSQQEPRETQA